MPTIHNGDCIETMNAMPPESVDAIVTDPPYGLGFMGKKWDGLPPSLEWAEACHRILKPGGHIAAFGGTRTWHRLAVAIEDAGFEMRDSLAWLYGSGFPKSMNVGKAIDKAAGAEREVVGVNETLRKYMPNGTTGSFQLGGCQSVEELELLAEIGGETPGGEDARKVLARRNDHEARFALTAPATPEAAQWDGWGTALKPAFEPIVLARKPLAEKTVARNVLAYGTGAINVDGCRIAGKVPTTTRGGHAEKHRVPDSHPDAKNLGRLRPQGRVEGNPAGRWPANVLLDQHAAAWVDEQSGVLKSGGYPPAGGQRSHVATYGKPNSRGEARFGSSEGGASRFFYTAKAPKRERPNVDGVQHPTVKPLAIMRWLIRLVTPPGGTVLDPFAGSGTTIEAALMEGFNPVGIEMEADYLPLIQHRIDRQAGTLPA